jgi:AcrR family transcriptional regulator
MIIAAAQDSIVECGFAATSARAIAARCGVAVGTVTYHFESVDALLVEALREASVRLTAEIEEAVAEQSGAVARLHSLIDNALPSSEAAKRNWRLWLEYWARASHVPELAALQSERYGEWRRIVLAVIREGVRTGELDVPDPRKAAIRFVALQDGLGLQAAIGDRAVTINVARKLLYETVEEFRPAPPSRRSPHRGPRSESSVAVGRPRLPGR